MQLNYLILQFNFRNSTAWMNSKDNQYLVSKKPLAIVEGLKKIGDCAFVEAVPQVHYVSVI